VTDKTSCSHRKTGKALSVQSLGYGLALQGIVVPFTETPKDVFSPPKNQDWLWGLPSFLFNRYGRFLTRRLSGRGGKLTAHLHSVLKSKVNGIILPLHNITSRSAREQLGEVCFIWIQGQKNKALIFPCIPLRPIHGHPNVYYRPPTRQ